MPEPLSREVLERMPLFQLRRLERLSRGLPHLEERLANLESIYSLLMRNSSGSPEVNGEFRAATKREIEDLRKEIKKINESVTGFLYGKGSEVLPSIVSKIMESHLRTPLGQDIIKNSAEKAVEGAYNGINVKRLVKKIRIYEWVSIGVIALGAIAGLYLYNKQNRTESNRLRIEIVKLQEQGKRNEGDILTYSKENKEKTASLEKTTQESSERLGNTETGLAGLKNSIAGVDSTAKEALARAKTQEEIYEPLKKRLETLEEYTHSIEDRIKELKTTLAAGEENTSNQIKDMQSLLKAEREELKKYGLALNNADKKYNQLQQDLDGRYDKLEERLQNLQEIYLENPTPTPAQTPKQ